MALVRGNVSLRLVPNYPALGLRQLVYTGRARQWPHRHMVWSVVVSQEANGGGEQWPLQVMAVPALGAEQIMTTLGEHVREVSLCGSVVNHKLYDPKREEWRIREKSIIESLSEEGGVRKLRKVLGVPRAEGVHVLRWDEARVLDMAQLGMPLWRLETGHVQDLLALDTERVRSLLEGIIGRGVASLRYVNGMQMRSWVMVAEGPPERLARVATVLARNTPTATVLYGGDWMAVVARIPKSDMGPFVRLPSLAQKEGIKAKCGFVQRYSGYQSDFFSRLRCDDGSLDDDVSVFLSQIRS